MFRALSWGCGTQSTALAVMSVLGELEPLDVVITADTGWESEGTYRIREFYTKWLQERGVRVEVVQDGNIRQLGADEHIHMPFFTGEVESQIYDEEADVWVLHIEGGGPLMRQCTQHFKIKPVRRRLRELLGYDASKPPHPKPGSIELWMGISWDEYKRTKKSRVKFIKHRWPLLEKKMTRNACIEYLESLKMPVPPKSACVGCPYRKSSEWLRMKQNSPLEFEQAVEFDNSIRENPLKTGGGGGSTASKLYVYKNKVPLASADFESDMKREKAGKAVPLFICDEGYCIV